MPFKLCWKVSLSVKTYQRKILQEYLLLAKDILLSLIKLEGHSDEEKASLQDEIKTLVVKLLSLKTWIFLQLHTLDMDQVQWRQNETIPFIIFVRIHKLNFWNQPKIRLDSVQIFTYLTKIFLKTKFLSFEF